MLTSAISATSTVVATAHSLMKTAGGEYTAASVAANPSLKDGNYVFPIVSAADRADGLDALNALKRGG